MTALKITYDNTSGLTAETVQAALDELVVNLGSSDSAILALSGRLDTLEGTGEGSVAKAIDDGIADVTDQAVKTNSTPSFNGIKFPTTQVPSADPNTLDDYEEGMWTPTVEGSTTAGVQTYNIQIGRYTKIGNRVFIQGGIAVTAKDPAIEGGIRITGLPFASANISGLEGVIATTRFTGFIFNSGYTQMSLYLVHNASRLGIRQQGSGKYDNDIPVTQTSLPFFVYFGGHYQI